MYIEKIPEFNDAFKLVYTLCEDLKKNPKRVEQANKLTLDTSKPHMGLKGNKGLFNSDEWWANIEKGNILSEYKQGIITELYEAGMDNEGRPNSFRYKDKSGHIFTSSMYFLDKKDFDLFKPGHWVIIYYAQLELKNGRLSNKVIEMAVSTKPINMACYSE